MSVLTLKFAVIERVSERERAKNEQTTWKSYKRICEYINAKSVYKSSIKARLMKDIEMRRAGLRQL